MLTKRPTVALIKVPPKIIVVIIVLLTSLFGSFVYLSNRNAERYVAADFATEIKPTEVDDTKHFGSLRGALFYDENRFVGGGAKLIGNNFVNKQLWQSYGPLVDLNEEPHQYTLYDLKLPFILSKKANSDTILILKDSIRFNFRLEKIEGDPEKP